MVRLANRNALVTGGAVGLGKAIAKRLKAEGARVVITDVDCEVGEVTAAEFGFTFLEQDVRNEARWSEVVGDVETYGGLHILVNNAGILGPMDATNPEDTRLSDWSEIFAVNVGGVFLGCRAAIPAMRRAGVGSIVNLSSVAGLQATPSATAYGASKAAVRQLTKSVAQHCAEQKINVRCNSILPGNILTPMWKQFAAGTAARRGVPEEEILAEGRSEAPLGDFTLPDDVAAAVAFLASDESRRITGAALPVDGGILDCDTYKVGSYA